jgi:carbon monoxide dehydrogenase subunit G
MPARGPSLTEETGEREYDGAMKVKLGPVTQQYKGTVKIQEADESAHRAVLRADGKDARGQGTASATITSTLHDEGNGSTRVRVETDMQITGRAAQFGQGIQQQVSEKLLGRFADCLEEEIVNGGAAAAAAGEQPSANGSSGEGTASSREPRAGERSTGKLPPARRGRGAGPRRGEPGRGHGPDKACDPLGRRRCRPGPRGSAPEGRGRGRRLLAWYALRRVARRDRGAPEVLEDLRASEAVERGRLEPPRFDTLTDEYHDEGARRD